MLEYQLIFFCDLVQLMMRNGRVVQLERRHDSWVVMVMTMMMMMIKMKFVDENQNIECVTTFLDMWSAGNRSV
jgi:uncharacterized membrane protein (UPF0127 family)